MAFFGRNKTETEAVELVLPKHVGIIMDGNGRWAKKRGLPRKAGHTGTLDPNATGVLPVLLGNATKAQDLIPNHDKKYTADFKLGTTTDTLDIWGKVLSQTETDVSEEQVLSALSGES